MFEENFIIQQKVICKTFQETGYCGYGETCKYMHERTLNNVDFFSFNENVCGICKKPPKEEVITLCCHSFCSDCVIMKCETKNICELCNKKTHGKFWVK